MKKFFRVLFQTLGIVFLLALIGGGVLLLYKGGDGVQNTVKSSEGVKVINEQMSFYLKDKLIRGVVYRPIDKDSTYRVPAVVYCQSMEYGKRWCLELAGKGLVCYAFDFSSDDPKQRQKELKEVMKQIGNLRYVKSSKVYLLGEGNGCVTACNFTFDNPRKLAGLMLLSPGFNPLELSRKAKRYNGQILVVDEPQGHDKCVKEITEYISGK